MFHARKKMYWGHVAATIVFYQTFIIASYLQNEGYKIPSELVLYRTPWYAASKQLI